MIFTIEGVSISLLANKVPWYVGLTLAIVGFYYLYHLLNDWKIINFYSETIASDIISKISLDGKLIPFFPFVGFALVMADIIIAKWFFNGYLGQLDIIILLNAGVWMLYHYIPNSYPKERDFLFIFMNLFTVSFVLPSIVWSTFLIEPGSSGELNYYGSSLVAMLLVEPLEKILSLLGFVVWSESDFLYYQDLESGTTRGVWVGKMCSGLYSVIIFICAFVSFVMVEFKKFNLPTILLIFLGIFTSYLANLIRMTIIVVIGHYYGTEALSWTHENLGWLIFTIWMGVFWAIMLKYLGPHPKTISETIQKIS